VQIYLQFYQQFDNFLLFVDQFPVDDLNAVMVLKYQYLVNQVHHYAMEFFVDYFLILFGLHQTHRFRY
jgi:hypothetical protein